jgi:hypothetical protein
MITSTTLVIASVSPSRSSRPAIWRDIRRALPRAIGVATRAPILFHPRCHRAKFKQKLALQGIDVGGGTPEQFGAYMRDEFAKWGHLVKENGGDGGLELAGPSTRPGQFGFVLQNQASAC